MAKGLRTLALVGLVGATAARLSQALERGGNIIIMGAGNSGNRFDTPSASDELADLLAQWPGITPVTEEELAATFEALRRRAMEGDPEAALVLIKVAREQQRQAQQEPSG
jgi:hypothetical protein